MLKPQDLLVAVRLASAPDEEWSFPRLASNLGISASEAHAGMKRAVASGLVDGERRSARRAALLEFLVHGVKYAFPPKWGGVTRGVPTSYAAPPLDARFSEAELPPVWAHPEGAVRGEGLAPLYPSIPQAARRDPVLHEWLALIDAVRAGRARERNLATKELQRRLS